MNKSYEITPHSCCITYKKLKKTHVFLKIGVIMKLEKLLIIFIYKCMNTKAKKKSALSIFTTEQKKTREAFV